MDATTVIRLAERIEAEPLFDAGLCRLAFDMVAAKLPAIDDAMIRNGALGGTDAVLSVIAHALPGWAITIHGTASETNPGWSCTLRRSDRRDDDPALGVGKGPLLGNVLIGALLKGMARAHP